MQSIEPAWVLKTSLFLRKENLGFNIKHSEIFSKFN